MRLAELLEEALGVDAQEVEARALAVEVAGVAQDHRRVAPGYVYVARRGATVDGHRFARLAVERGAVAVVGSNPGVKRLPWRGVPYVHVEDDRAALARLAATFYAHPSRALTVLGVTGTDGKTTTAFLLHHLLGARYPSALISTAGVRLEETPLALEGHFTTPEAPEVQRLLAQARDEGCTHVVLESSSHGFAQRRLDEVAYGVGVWTNLSPEHLDFHGTFAAYREAKATLMRRAEVSVLNRDDPEYPFFAAAAQRVISYGLAVGSDYRALELRSSPAGQRFTVLRGGETFEADLPLLGSYNVHNALAALAAAEAVGVPLTEALARLANFPGVPGRMQRVAQEPFAVVVDFAHTPPALAKALEALRPVTRGRLIAVVGAAGERDPGKRRPLGEAALRHADLAVFTEEDSRSERTERILAELAAGAAAAGGVRGERFWLEPERRAAIRKALALARPGDTVALFGKGHESTLERADEVLAWDEAAEARRALAELGLAPSDEQATPSPGRG